MVSGLGYPLIVTPVMKVNGPRQKDSGGVRQNDADLVQHQFLLAGHDQKLEAAVQSFAITHRGSHLHDVRRAGDGKLQGNNFADPQRGAKSRPDAVLAEFAGSAPTSGHPAFAKHRHLDARVEAITGETPQLPVSFGGRWCVGAQASLSIADPSRNPAFWIVLQCGPVLNGIKVHVLRVVRVRVMGAAAASLHCASFSSKDKSDARQLGAGLSKIALPSPSGVS